MKLEHIAIYVIDLEATKDFFIKFFDAKANDMYHNPKTGLKSYFLTFDDKTETGSTKNGGALLEILTRPNIEDDSKGEYRSGYIHIAFKVGSKERVDELTQTLETAGYTVASRPRTTGDGYYESCIIGPENNLIEIIE